jgi:hypothetical protein
MTGRGPRRHRLPDYFTGATRLTILELGLDATDPHDVLLATVFRLAAELERRSSPWDSDDWRKTDVQRTVSGHAVQLLASITPPGHVEERPVGAPHRARRGLATTSARTVTVSTVDHGPVTITCPPWCTDAHPAGGYRVDIAHAGREVPFDVVTSRGTATVLLAALEQRPYTEAAPGTGVFVAVEIGGDCYPSSPEQLENLADALTGHAVGLRALAVQLAALRQNGGEL